MPDVERRSTTEPPDRAAHELEAARRRAVALASVAQALNAGHDLPEVLSAALRGAADALGAGDGSIFLFENGSGLVYGAAEILPRGRLGLVADPAASPGRRRAIDERRAVVLGLEDASGEEIEWFARTGSLSSVNVPLLLRDRCLGVLILNFVVGYRPCREDLALAENVATQCAVAIDRAIAYREREVLLERVEEERARLAGLFANLSEGVVVSEAIRDAQGRVVDWIFREANPAWLGVAGRPAAEVIDRRASEVFGFADVHGAAIADQVLTTGEVVRTEFTMPGGRVFLVSTFRLDERRFVGVGVDVSEERRAREEREGLLREVQTQAAELEAVFDALADGVIRYGPRGEILRINPAAMQILGYGDRSCLTPALCERLVRLDVRDGTGQPLAPEDSPIRAALAGGTARNVEISIGLADGSRRWLTVSAAPVAGPGGGPAGAVLTLVDVTALRAIQEQREDLTRTISHDLRTPLTAIITQAQLLQRRATRPDTIRHRAGAIATSAARMNVMIQDLVDMTRLESGQLALEVRPIELRAYLGELRERFRGAVEVERVRLELADDLPPVRADPDRFERVVLNLMSNALKYSPLDREVVVRAGPADGRVVLEVIDRGQGISPDDLPMVFERFFRSGRVRKSDGLGLGLYIARLLVEAQGGTLEVESRLGEGSVFRVALPRA